MLSILACRLHDKVFSHTLADWPLVKHTPLSLTGVHQPLKAGKERGRVNQDWLPQETSLLPCPSRHLSRESHSLSTHGAPEESSCLHCASLVCAS